MLGRNYMMIIELESVTIEIVEAFQRLIPQLTQYSPLPFPEAIMRMAASPAATIFIARHPDEAGEIVGMATLGTFETPTGVHGWIEDVVVDREFRHQGIGRALTEACIAKAREMELREVNLTSNPGREDANQLYQSMGFILRLTNVYRLPLD